MCKIKRETITSFAILWMCLFVQVKSQNSLGKATSSYAYITTNLNNQNSSLSFQGLLTFRDLSALHAR